MLKHDLKGNTIKEGMNYGTTKALCGCSFIVEYVKNPVYGFVQRAVVTGKLDICPLDHSVKIEQWTVKAG